MAQGQIFNDAGSTLIEFVIYIGIASIIIAAGSAFMVGQQNKEHHDVIKQAILSQARTLRTRIDCATTLSSTNSFGVTPQPLCSGQAITLYDQAGQILVDQPTGGEPAVSSFHLDTTGYNIWIRAKCFACSDDQIQTVPENKTRLCGTASSSSFAILVEFAIKDRSSAFLKDPWTKVSYDWNSLHKNLFPFVGFPCIPQ